MWRSSVGCGVAKSGLHFAYLSGGCGVDQRGRDVAQWGVA